MTARAAQPHASRGLLLLTISNALYVATGYVLNVWLARHLGSAAFGRYGVVIGIVTVVNVIVARGVPVAAARLIAAAPGAVVPVMRAALRAIVPVSAGFALVTLASAVPLGALLGDHALVAPLLVGAAAAVTYAVHTMALAPFVGEQRYLRQAVVQSLYALLRLGAIVAGALAAGVTGAVAGFVVAPLVAAIAALRRYRGTARTAAPGTVPGQRDLLRQSAPLVLAASSIALLLSIDLIAFKRVGTSSDAGIYAAAANIAHVPYFLLASATYVLLPGVAAARDAAHLREVVRRGFGDVVALLALPTALLVAIGDRATTLIFGSAYDSHSLVVAPLAIATAAITLHSIGIAIDGGMTRMKTGVALGATGLVLVAAGVTVAGAGSSLTGAAWAAAAATSLVAVVHMALVRRRVGALLDRRAPVFVALAAVLAAGCWLLGTSTLAIVGGSLVATCAYVAIVVGSGLFQLRRTGGTSLTGSVTGDDVVEPLTP